MDTITAEEFLAAGIEGWTAEGVEARASYTTPDFATALELVNKIGALAEAADHHPDITLKWGSVELVLSTHSAGGLTEQDVELARQIAAVVS